MPLALVENTLSLGLRGPEFNPMYRQIHRGSTDQSGVIGSYPKWHAEESPGTLINGYP